MRRARVHPVFSVLDSPSTGIFRLFQYRSSERRDCPWLQLRASFAVSGASWRREFETFGAGCVFGRAGS
jgi:hypothetical protein